MIAAGDAADDDASDHSEHDDAVAVGVIKVPRSLAAAFAVRPGYLGHVKPRVFLPAVCVFLPDEGAA